MEIARKSYRNDFQIYDAGPRWGVDFWQFRGFPRSKGW